MVVPYAYEPTEDSLARLRTLLTPALGEHLAVDSRAPVAYGDEESFVHHLGNRGGGIVDVIVLLCNLAATPEDENHGRVIAGVRDWMTTSACHVQLLLMVDAGPYAARMAPHGGAKERMVERRCVWRDFIAARGLTACIVDLAASAPPEDRTQSVDRGIVDQVRAALWHPSAM